MWKNNVTLGAPGVGLITLPYDYYAVPRVLVGKVHQEVCPQGCRPLAPLHRAPKPGKDGRKGHPILY